MAIPAWAAAATQGALSIGSTLIAGYQNRKNQKRQNEANKDLAAYSYDRDVAMWEAANRYNSPEAQMKRLTEAGLNPNLVYGTGTVTGNTSGATPKYNTPEHKETAKAFDTQQALGMYTDLAMRTAQIENIQANTEKTKVDTRAVDISANQKDSLWSYTAAQKQADSERTRIDVDRSLQNVRLMKQQEQLNELSRQYAEKNLTSKEIENEQRQADLEFSKWKNELSKFGITTGDSPLMRLLIRAWNQDGMKENISSFAAKIFGGR